MVLGWPAHGDHAQTNLATYWCCFTFNRRPHKANFQRHSVAIEILRKSEFSLQWAAGDGNGARLLSSPGWLVMRVGLDDGVDTAR
jgi:hypothetical protein